MAANVWVALAAPNPANGGVPYINSVDQTPSIDVLNLKWDQVLFYMYMSNGFKTDYTIAPAAGAVQINKASGVVKVAAAGLTVVLTNSLVKDANSIVIPFLLDADATAKSVVAVAAAGSVTFTLNAAATAQVRIGFLVLRNSEV